MEAVAVLVAEVTEVRLAQVARGGGPECGADMRGLSPMRRTRPRVLPYDYNLLNQTKTIAVNAFDNQRQNRAVCQPPT